MTSVLGGGWLGNRVFGLTLMLRSLSLCDLLCCSLREVLCESYALGVLGSLGSGAGGGGAGEVCWKWLKGPDDPEGNPRCW